MRSNITSAVYFVLTLACLSVSADICKSPCHPWLSDDTCTRKTGRIDIRWGLTLPGTINRDGANVSYLSYGFCANVDELQSFQLNSSAIYITLNKTINSTGGSSYSYLPTTSNLWAYGAGSGNSVLLPGDSNSSNVMVYENPNADCNDGPAIATMLIYNVTLDNGKYKYQNGVPVGVGFQPTCDKDNICRLDADLKCIGRDGEMNCAYCLNKNDPFDVINRDIVIFHTYYGTDARGKTLISGSSNPLNFRAFSGGGSYSTISRDLANMRDTAKEANPLRDVDSYDLDGLRNVRLSTKVPNANIDG